MHGRRDLKAGFSLMELMVVAIIISILVVAAIPLVNGNRRRAWATEAQTACGTIRTALRIILNHDGAYPSLSDAPVYPSVHGISEDDLDGKFFRTTDYRVTSTSSNFTITCTGTATEVQGLTVILDSNGNWSGTLLQ